MIGVAGATGLLGKAFMRHLGKGALPFGKCEFDHIIHAAGYGEPARFMATPYETIDVNTSFLFHLARYLKPGGSLLFLSSSEVYSGSIDTPYTEQAIGSTNPEHPRACYIESKRCGEAIVHAMRAQGINAKIIRLAAVYGPTNKDDNRVLPFFVKQALTAGVIKLRDQGLALRTYCYVDDAVKMMMNVLYGGSQAVYNISAKKYVTIYELAELIAKMTGARVDIPLNSMSIRGAPNDVIVNIDRYCQEFGEPVFTSLESGLAMTINAMCKELDLENDLCHFASRT